MSNTPERNVDWDLALDQVTGSFKTALSRFLTGDDADVERFLEELAEDTVLAIQEGRDELVQEIRAQVRVRGERLRLAANEKAWGFIQEVATVVARVGITVLTGSAQPLLPFPQSKLGDPEE